MGMSFLWETSHGMGQHTFVFPMKLRIEWERQNVTEMSYLDYFWILKSINFVVLHVSLYMQSYLVDTKPKLSLI